MVVDSYPDVCSVCIEKQLNICKKCNLYSEIGIKISDKHDFWCKSCLNKSTKQEIEDYVNK